MHATPTLRTKTFLLGVGAQKAGTTWLHQYLSGFDSANFGLHKEYHIWDAVSSDLCAEFRVTPAMLTQTGDKGLQASAPDVLRYAMQHFAGVYEGYFASLVEGDKWLTGDITPAYACLSAETLSRLRQALERAGLRVKVVFLMRDPFERCWSAVRMYKRTGALIGSDEACLERSYRTPQFQFRTNYHHTIQALECAFGSEAIFYGLYEDLFTRSSLGRLSDFLEMPPNYDAVDQRFNTSPKSEACRPDLRQDVITFYSDVYAYCYERFPNTRALWHTL